MCLFIGYADHKKDYRCYDPVARRLRISRHLTGLNSPIEQESQHYRSFDSVAGRTTWSSIP